MDIRSCSRAACGLDAVATLTYNYDDSMIVVGPLSNTCDPHRYDLCELHSSRFSAPKGWQVVRHAPLRDFSIDV